MRGNNACYCYEFCTMTVHIGNLIKKRVEEKGMNKSEFTRRINTTSQNIHGIFKRKSIDTALLQKISELLDFDFFQYYSPFQKEIQKLKEENQLLKEMNAFLKEKKRGRK